MNFDFKFTPWAMISTYAIFNSFIYSWFFWIRFNINILQFVSFTDLIPSILYILAIPCVAIILGSSLVILWERSRDRIESFFLKTIRRWTTKFDALALFAPLFLPLSFMLLVIFYLYHSGHNEISKASNSITDMIFIFGSMLACTISGYAVEYKTNFLIHFNQFRRVAIITIFATPSICYTTAIINANNVINGVKTFLVATDVHCSDNPKEQYRYISSISDKAFSLSLNDSSICVFKYNHLRLTPETGKTYEIKIDSNAV